MKIIALLTLVLMSSNAFSGSTEGGGMGFTSNVKKEIYRNSTGGGGMGYTSTIDAMTSIHPTFLIKELKLRDGRTVSNTGSISKIHKYNGKLDYAVLKSGEIVDRTDVKDIVVTNTKK